MSLGDRSRATRARVAGAFGALLLVACLPLMSVTIPPLLDYPNHLARMYLLADAGRTAALAAAYAIDWRPLPNLAMDVIVPPLAHVLPIDGAGRLFVALIFVVTMAGLVALHRVVHRGWSYWPLVGFLLLYNRILLWGFLNYLAGLGVALIGLALWRGLEGQRRWRRLGAVALAALAAYFCHVVAFGLLALMILGGEARALILRVRARRWGAATRLAVEIALPLLPPALLWLGTWHPGPGDGGGLAWAHPWRKFDLLFSVFDAYNRPFDGLCFAAVLLSLAIGFWRGFLAVDRRLMESFLLAALAYAIMPARVIGGSGLDHRLPILLFLLLLAAIRPVGWRHRPALLIGAALLILFGVRMALVERAWLAADRVYQPIIAALGQLPRTSRIAVASGPGAVGAGDIPLLHLPTMAIILVDAFVPTEFTYAGQQPIALTPAFAALADLVPPDDLWNHLTSDDPAQRAQSTAALSAYDALVMVDRRGVPALTPACTRLLYAITPFRLYAIERAGEACAPG